MRALAAAMALLACEGGGEPSAARAASDAGRDAAPHAEPDASATTRDVPGAPDASLALPDRSAPDAASPGDVFAPVPDAARDLAAADAPAVDARLAGCVELVALGDFTIFAYEASRADDGGGPCSRPGALPWTGVTVAEAAAACEAGGFSLCTHDQWHRACAGPEENRFPYGPRYVNAACNDHLSGGNALEPTGNRPDCHTAAGVFDLSGNVWELTAESERRGGSFRVNASTFREEYAGCVEALSVNELFADDDTGFRCCGGP